MARYAHHTPPTGDPSAVALGMQYMYRHLLQKQYATEKLSVSTCTFHPPPVNSAMCSHHSHLQQRTALDAKQLVEDFNGESVSTSASAVAGCPTDGGRGSCCAALLLPMPQRHIQVPVVPAEEERVKDTDRAKMKPAHALRTHEQRP